MTAPSELQFVFALVLQLTISVKALKRRATALERLDRDEEAVRGE